jgi:hypothetical protein
MQHQPFEHVRLSAAREVALHSSIANTHADSIGTVGGVEMRRVVIVVEYRDGDSKKAADYGHAAILILSFRNRESENSDQYHLNADVAFLLAYRARRLSRTTCRYLDA